MAGTKLSDAFATKLEDALAQIEAEYQRWYDKRQGEYELIDKEFELDKSKRYCELFKNTAVRVIEKDEHGNVTFTEKSGYVKKVEIHNGLVLLSLLGGGEEWFYYDELYIDNNFGTYAANLVRGLFRR